MEGEPKGPQTEKLDKHGYLFGQKIKASLSPLFHDTIFKALGLKWEQLRLDSADIEDFLRRIKDPDCFGASITMPNKIAIMQHLEETTDECREVGACNTIFYKKGPDGRRIMCGTNTDVVGVRDAFYKNVSDPDAVFRNKPAMVVGGGGAARSAVYALSKWMGVTEIYLVSRDETEVDAVLAESRAAGYGDTLIHVSSIEQAQRLETPGAVVSGVPDVPPGTEEEKLARSIVETFLGREEKGVMLEMCYNPTPYTELGGIAERAGWKVILGTEAMIWQGFEQAKYWTGLEVDDLPRDLVKEVIAAYLAKAAE